MSVAVDQDSARSLLTKDWGEIAKTTRPPAKMQQLIESVLNASDVTFKYILVTGFLAKATNPAVHARALQVGSSLKGAYDARSLCHKVVVGFEKSKGNLFGLSNEPFVNKPARHPEHDGENTQLRNRLIARQLHEALELAQTVSAADVNLGLVHILRIGAGHAASIKATKIVAKVNHSKLLRYIQTFLGESDGGSRLVGVWGAFVSLLAENGTIKVYSPNAPDSFGKTAGDVEVYYNDVLVSAAECKQRPLSVDDVNHGIKKALEKGVPEYHFVFSAGIVKGQENAVLETIKTHSADVDLYLFEIPKAASILAAMLNPTRRAMFGLNLSELLRQMRKFDSANAAADLWNEIID